MTRHAQCRYGCCESVKCHNEPGYDEAEELRAAREEADLLGYDN